jgi:predicted phage-related endonuclease
LKGESFKITMPTVKKVSFDSKAFSADYPDLFEKYKIKESSYRSFIVSEIRRE